QVAVLVSLRQAGLRLLHAALLALERLFAPGVRGRGTFVRHRDPLVDRLYPLLDLLFARREHHVALVEADEARHAGAGQLARRVEELEPLARRRRAQGDRPAELYLL